MAVTKSKILGKSAQKNALKCQLNVRKTILEQPANKELFAFSKEKIQHSPEKLKENLEELMSSMPPPDSLTRKVADNPTMLVRQQISHNWFNSDLNEDAKSKMAVTETKILCYQENQ